jgi:hypothetical protein
LIDVVLYSSFGVEMIRTVWLAALFLAVICGLCASKVTASISPPEDGVPDQTMVSFATDTLTKSDRLDIASLPLQPVATFTLPPDPVAIFSHGASTTSSTVRVHPPLKQIAKRSTVMLPRPRPKVKLPPTGQIRSASLR